MGLITLQQAKDYMGITVTTSDTLISTYIDIVSSEVDAYTNRRLGVNTYTDTIYFGTSQNDKSPNLGFDQRVGYPKYQVDQVPVQSVVSVTQANTVIDSDLYIIDSSTGILTFETSVYDSDNDLIVSYIAGYTTVTGSDYTVPFELQGVVMEGVKAMFQNGGTARQGVGNVKSKRIKDFSVDYGNSQTGLYAQNGLKSYIANSKVILNKYKRWAL